jgi:hypothetical protein
VIYNVRQQCVGSGQPPPPTKIKTL